MYSWPSHYPESCPPPEATDLIGVVYRFINGANPSEKDFKSHYERQPGENWGNKACEARGLSVLRTPEDCGEMRKAVPALRKKSIAIANIEQSVGVIKVTPSNSCENHCTWWRSLMPSDVVGMFKTEPSL